MPTRKTMIVTAAAAAALVIPTGAAVAAVAAPEAEVPPPVATKAEARAAAAAALAQARELQRGPATAAKALDAAKQAGPAARAHLADAKADALAARYTPAYAKSYAKSFMQKRYGWGEAEYQAVVEMWTLESQWDYTAENPTSGAYGIPQSLPANKMASEGKDYRTNPEPQIRWGLKYIQSTYGSPTAALSFWHANNWY